MPEYGITKTGVNIKRLDTIMNELHDELSEGWGINTRINTQSYLNVELTSFGDKIAELWEFGQQIYDSFHPSSAENASLDAACQYAGVERQPAARTRYPVHCTGKDGTLLEIGTVISANTNPRIDFFLDTERKIERASCNKAVLRVVAVSSSTYTVSINGTVYSYAAQDGDTEKEILEGLATQISVGGTFTATVRPETALLPFTLFIEASDIAQNYAMLLTENMTTESVTSIINFSSIDFGEIIVPFGAISIIAKGPAGFLACENRCSYVAGRLRETDTEFRQSYAAKIYNLASREIAAIKAAILSNVQGVTSVAGYHNDQDEPDAEGRYPHSIEIIVDGGSPTEIATQILNKKSAGINTFGSVETDIPGNSGEPITIRFNRPVYVYVWWHLGIFQDPASQLPSDYATKIKKIIVDAISKNETGDDVIPQEVFKLIYKDIPGIAYIDVKLYSTTSETTIPSTSDFEKRFLTLSDRERAITKETMIEVSLDG